MGTWQPKLACTGKIGIKISSSIMFFFLSYHHCLYINRHYNYFIILFEKQIGSSDVRCYGDVLFKKCIYLLTKEDIGEKRILDDEEGDEMLYDEDFDAEDEAEEEDDGPLDEEQEEEEEEEEEVKESTKMKVLRIVAGVASKVKDIIGNLITTAGKVVVTILLGLTGEQLHVSLGRCSAEADG